VSHHGAAGDCCDSGFRPSLLSQSPKPEPLVNARISAFASCGRATALALVRLVQTHAPQQIGIHSINSSARPDRGSGMVMPSVLAVLRLMTSSTFTAW